MQGSTRSKPRSDPALTAAGTAKAPGLPFIPRPRTMGVFVILVTALAFTAGWFRNELALTLLGTVFLTILSYCFLGVFFLGLFYRPRVRLVSMTITPEAVNVGKEGELCIGMGGGSAGKNRFFKLPALFIRCGLCLETKDGRVIRHFADPRAEEYSKFSVRERGAFFGGEDLFIIFDGPGFFRLSFPIRQNESSRLLALPAPAEEVIRFSLRSGGTEQRNEAHYRKSDELSDHRPYIPGDDPRRINWKLFGHAPQGELFVREGEPEPPPHSRLLILIDTEADSSLYTADEGRRALDLLCENALSAALELSGRGMDILTGYTGGKIPDSGGSGSAGELAAAFALPAAIFCPAAPGRRGQAEPDRELPKAPRDRSVLILALPRASSEISALDRFLKNREAGQGVDIVFLYGAGSPRSAPLEESARICVNLYNGKTGVHAVKAAVFPSGKNGGADRESEN